MNFDFTAEQEMFKSEVERLLGDHYSFKQREFISVEGWSRPVWTLFAETGLLGLNVAEENGGVGATPVETMIVMDGIGRYLALEPFLPSAVLASTALSLAGSSKSAVRLLKDAAAGRAILTLAHSERGTRYDLSHVTTTARKTQRGWLIQGSKSLVPYGAQADFLVVSARMSGEISARDGMGLFIVPGSAKRLQRREYRLHDGSLSAELAFADVLVPNEDALDVSGRGFDVIERAYQAGIAALAAEAVGAMAAALDLTVEHLKMRRQFNVPIATFQALQHRAAEMLLWLEQARSMALFGTLALVGEDIDQRRSILAAVKVQIGRSARFIGQSAIQLHGGIGMASEYPVGHYFRRLTAIERLLGDADHHLATLVGAGGLLSATG
jgi:alkylation response protein AidB-like acyl-CoA dehydrogenase